MTKPLIACSIVCLLIGADKADDEAVKKELASIQGTWKGVKGESQGKPLQDESVKTLELIFKGDKYTFNIDGQEMEQGTITLDPAKKPKMIDIKITKGADKGKMQYGLYEVKGNRFTICFAPPEKERPKELTTKADSEHTCYVFERLES